MSDIGYEAEKGGPTSITHRGSIGEDVSLGYDDAGAIPKGTIDPVYEAKARVLNRAVGLVIGSSSFTAC